MDFLGKWITAKNAEIDVVPQFIRNFYLEKPVRKAVLTCTALGVYETFLNGKRVGEFILAPGWTAYEKRLQMQEYDVTELLERENTWAAHVGAGWYASPLGWCRDEEEQMHPKPKAFLGALHILYEDGTEEVVSTDERWMAGGSAVRFSEIYDGEIYDATFVSSEFNPVQILNHSYDILIPQEGEEIREQRRIAAREIFRTPAGEIVVDFGQEVTGYVEFSVEAKEGERIHILHGEVLDKIGNFYNANYRSAKAEIRYICREGLQTYHPHLTYFGFRYVKLEQWPQDFGDIRPEQFEAIVVYSAIRRTGYVNSSDAKLNRLFSNIFWSQVGNFLDVPTDCPQRDERLGWTGDAEVFVRAASYNFNVNKFFTKWLHDMTVSQFPDGGIPHVVPDVLTRGDFEAGTVDMAACSAAWGDAVCICPWQLYRTYGNVSILKDEFDSMRKWVDYIGTVTKDEYLWTGGTHFGDWLGLDAPAGSYKGSTRDDFIASAYYANSVCLVIRAGHVLGRDVKSYELLYERMVEKFRKTFTDYRTQTEHVLALYFQLSENGQETADALAAMIRKDGSMKTGFLGTPYLLHVLSDYGYAELAYELLLREEYPSWLYSVGKGATTVWEHWDGIMENGEFWSTDMNSFNHYAYGSVIDWVYEKALGIQIPEDGAGFTKVRIAPVPSDRLEHLEASIETVSGRVSSGWRHVDGRIRYDLELPVDGTVVIEGREHSVKAGKYTFWNTTF